MNRIRHQLENLDLNDYAEVPNMDISILELDGTIKQNKQNLRSDLEKYRKISFNCIHDKSAQYNSKRYSKDFSTKLFVIFLTSIMTYYGIYQITLIYLQDNMDTTLYDMFIFLFLAAFLFLLTIFIYRKEFGNTQFMVYTIIYCGFSFLGIITIMTRVVPFTSYQIINLFIVLIIIQTLAFAISTPITKKLVCRIDQSYHDIESI